MTTERTQAGAKSNWGKGERVKGKGKGKALSKVRGVDYVGGKMRG